MDFLSFMFAFVLHFYQHLQKISSCVVRCASGEARPLFEGTTLLDLIPLNSTLVAGCLATFELIFLGQEIRNVSLMTLCGFS